MRHSQEFRAVLGNGRRATKGRVVLYVLLSGAPTRVGFVVARSVGGAVVRNRARRQLREAWRAVAGRVRDGFDVVVVARPNIRGSRTQELIADMRDALGSAGVLDGPGGPIV